MNKENIDIFENAPIGKAIARMAVPSMLGMLVTIAYNIADTLFVGWTNDPNQVAAVSVATPVFMLLMAVGNIFSVGGGTYISRLLGTKEYERVKNVSAFCIYSSVFFGLCALALYEVFKSSILRVIGTTAATMPLADEYLSWVFVGAAFVTAQFTLGGIIRAEGSSKNAVTGMMTGTILNIVLDPIFILALKMGVAGAAIATILGNIASCGYYVWYFLRKPTFLSMSPKHFPRDAAIAKAVAAIGLPVSITNLMMSLSNILMNKFLSTYGNSAVASMGIAMKANSLVILSQIGLASGLQPLIGYNYAAKNFKRLGAFLRQGMLIGVAMGVFLTSAYEFFAPKIVSAFIPDPQIVGQGSYFLRVLSSPGPIVSIMFILQFAIQAMGKALAAFVLAVSRQGFVFMPIVVVGNSIFGLNGIVFAQPAADLVAIFIAAAIYFHYKRKEMQTPCVQLQ